MKRKRYSSVCALLALSLPTAACAGSVIVDPLSAGTVTQAAPVAGCTEAQIGPAYDAVVESSAMTECFQFVTEAAEQAAKLNVVVAGLPVDGAHDVHLIRVNDDGTTVAAASDVSGGTYSLLQAIAPPLTRWLLMLGGQGIQPGVPFQFQAEVVANPDIYEPNDTPEHPSVLKGNQHIEATLDSASDVDLYVVSVGKQQSSARLSCGGSGDVVCEVLSRGRWVVVPQSGPIEVSASMTVPLILRARWKEGSTQTVGSYTLHTFDPASRSIIATAGSSENISHLAPGKETPFPVPEGVTPVPGGANAARQIDVTAVVFDSDETTRAPAGEHVRLVAVDYAPATKRRITLATVDGLTNARGEFSARLPIGPCAGIGMVGPIRMNRPSNHPDYWDITYVPTAYVMALLDGKSATVSASAFQHVCQETYRAYRKPLDLAKPRKHRP
ncbi:hypothetical protein Y886_21070 [Xanthomonas hyacinthi DSM 19077]|nr:hypothetical protein Y886_21070 [Xanthomonas hyacinthi DSM 19077]